MTSLATSMVNAAVGVASATAAFIVMDFWAAFLHRRVWHGPLWRVHRSHHIPRTGAFEANDWLSGLHAPIAVVLILLGARAPALGGSVALGGGVGMTAFGLFYLLVHDGVAHGRLPIPSIRRISWLTRIVAAHRRHHGDARGGPPYGLVFGPGELRRARLSGALRARAESPSARLPRGPTPA